MWLLWFPLRSTGRYETSERKNMRSLVPKFDVRSSLVPAELVSRMKDGERNEAFRHHGSPQKTPAEWRMATQKSFIWGQAVPAQPLVLSCTSL